MIQNRTSTMRENIASSNTSHQIPVGCSQLVMQTLEGRMTGRMRYEVDSAVATI